MSFFVNNILLIFILPLIAASVAFAAHFFKFTISEKSVKFLSVLFNIVTLVFSFVFVYYFYTNTDAEPIQTCIDWFKIDNISISFGILADKISSIFLFAISLISLIVQIVLIKFLKNNNKINLNNALLNLFLLSNFVFILSSNLMQSVIMSIVTSSIIFACFNINQENKALANTAHKFIVTDFIGNYLFLSAMIIIFYFTYNYELNFEAEFLSYIKLHEFASDLYVYMSDNIFYMLCILLFFGIVVKTALFPFNFRIIQLFKIKSPISSILYFSMIGTCAIFTFRLLPIFELSQYMYNFIYIICLLSFAYSLLWGLLNKYNSHYLDCIYFSILILYIVFSNEFSVFGLSFAWIITLISLDCIASLWRDLQLKYSTEIELARPKFIKNLNINFDLLERLFDWIVDNILDVPRNLIKVLDKYVITFIMDFWSLLIRFISWLVSISQNGKIQNYILYSIFFIILMLLLYIVFIIGGSEI